MLVTSRFPLPPWRGNQLRTIQWLDALADFECLLLCPTGTGPHRDRLQTELCHLPHSRVASTLGLLAAVVSGRPAQEGLYESRAAKRVVAEATAARRPDLAVIQMVRCGWAMDAIRGVDPTLPVLFDAIDCMALHYERAATVAPPLLGSAYRFEAMRCLRRESELVRRAAVTTAVSGRDLRALGADLGGMVVPVTGGSEAEPRIRTDRGATVLLSGNLGYRPTVRAALWFADRVWPRLRKLVPAAHWVLAGARPAAAIRRLASRPGIEVHGDVDDLGAFFDRADVAIAPMASGSGVPIKILEAMAAGVPVVVDPWSAAGLEDPSAVVVAAGEGDWIRVLVELLGDAQVASDQAARGLEVWRAVYRPDRVRAGICEAVDAALSRAG